MGVGSSSKRACGKSGKNALSFFLSTQAIPWEEYPSWAKDGLTDIPAKGNLYGPVAVLDGQVLTTHSFKAWEKGGFYNDVPFMVGTAEQETDFR